MSQNGWRPLYSVDFSNNGAIDETSFVENLFTVFLVRYVFIFELDLLAYPVQEG